MEEEQSDKKSEIDWKNTYDEQIQGAGSRNINHAQNRERQKPPTSIQENLRKIQPYKRKSTKKTTKTTAIKNHS